MHLEILTPEKKYFEGDVSIVTFPGADGSFQVMDNHAPLISLLKEKNETCSFYEQQQLGSTG